jgi:hypothetical protein
LGIRHRCQQRSCVFIADFWRSHREDRLPRLLLLVNERRSFGGRHRIRIAAERCKPPLQFRVEGNFAQVFAYLIDDCLVRADGRYQDSPASGLETGNRFRHGGTLGNSATRTMGIRDRPIPPRSPRQNAYFERLIGTLRRESLSRPENRQHVHSLCIADDHFTCVRGTAEIRMSARAESQSSQIIRLNVGDFFTST